MTYARSQHPNAPLTPEGRRRMVACVVEQGWTIEATAERFQVDAKTVRKWRDRFLADGEDGLRDRSCRPKRSPNRTQRSTVVAFFGCGGNDAGVPITSHMRSGWRLRPCNRF